MLVNLEYIPVVLNVRGMNVKVACHKVAALKINGFQW